MLTPAFFLSPNGGASGSASPDATGCQIFLLTKVQPLFSLSYVLILVAFMGYEYSLRMHLT